MKCAGSGIARLAALLVVVAAGAHLLSATTLYVGNCRSGTFTTIQGAITAAPYGATVKVCPGTYNEQVSIGQSVILEGMTSHNDDQVFIVPPSGGLIINTDDISGRQVAAQVSVKNASGPVTISNVAVIGSGNGWSTCQPLIAGIFYQNSSGTINRVITTEQNTNHCGNGIWVEGGPSNPVVTVENSFVRSFDQYGINTETYNQPPTELTVKVTGNKLWGDAAARAGIYVDQGSTATVSANDVLGQASTFQYGIWIWVNSTGSVSSNSVQNAIFGIGLHSDGVTVSSNKLLQVNTGIDLQTAVGTVKGNDIVGGVGIEFNCNSNPHVLSNSISGANVGIDKVPFGLVTPNSYFVVAQIVSNGC